MCLRTGTAQLGSISNSVMVSVLMAGSRSESNGVVPFRVQKLMARSKFMALIINLLPLSIPFIRHAFIVTSLM